MKTSQLAIAIFLALVVTACQREVTTNRLHGHYEDSDDTVLLTFKHKQKVIAEHAPSQGVLMAYTMFTEHHREDMAKAFLETDIESLWIVVPYDYTQTEQDHDLKTLYMIAGSLGSKIKILRQPVSGKLREWARDFAPLSARTESGELRLLDFNYHADRPADDSVPQELSRMLEAERVSIPVYNEGGNFMSNTRGDCLMTERVLVANDSKEAPEDMILDRQQIIDYYKDYAGCSRVVIFPSMPYEGTRHIDIWGKFINDSDIIVSEISDRVLNNASYSDDERKKVADVKEYLEDRAAEIKQMGFRVLRVPMPAPFFATDGFNLFRSYTNSLILNGNAFVPSYSRPSNPLDGVNGQYIDADLTNEYNKKVRELYTDLGLKVKWIDSDSLISKGGAVHCTTMQIAR